MAAALAMYNAPVGATPCESAFNAFKASLDVSNTTHVKAVVARLAPHDEFIARCTEQPGDVQKCLVPAYLAKNRPQCIAVKPSPEALKAMVELRVSGEIHNPDDDDPSQKLPPR